MWRVIAIGLLVLRASSDLQADQTPEVTLHGTTVARFASQEQARELLTEHDAFLSSLSQVDRDVRLSRADVTPEQFVDHVRLQARSWETEPQERIAGLLRNIAGKLERLTLPLPPHVWLVRTSGLEEAEAAYCRGNVIVLPEKIDRLADERLETLLIHELFHVISNQNPELRRAMYRVIGFELIEPLTLPPSLERRKITNPDAPVIDCYFWTLDGDQVVPAAPLLLSKTTGDEVYQRSLFELLDFRLVVLDVTPSTDERLATATVRLRDGQPVLLEPQSASLYWNIGLNTKYVIHPDEILADNFVHLVYARTQLPTPRIPQELGQILGTGIRD